MRARVTLAALLLAGIAIGSSACGESSPIVRPANERGVSSARLGRELFAANCAACHGFHGEGVPKPTRSAGGRTGQGPPLRGVGARAADFYLRLGYMPLDDPHHQPWHEREVDLTPRERGALVRFVASLGGGPSIPHPRPQDGSVSDGLELFTEHCAGCHQVVGQGGYVTGARVPTLQSVDATEIAESVRTGPYLMPSFSERQISDRQLDSIIAYVQRTAQRPDDRGGWGIGHIGPVPEGLVTWLIALAVLVAICVVIGARRHAR